MGALSLNLVAEAGNPAAAAAGPTTAAPTLSAAAQPEAQELSLLGGALATALAALAPRCLALPLSVGALNARPWWPRRDQNTQRLVSGLLQLAPNTQVCRCVGAWLLSTLAAAITVLGSPWSPLA